VAWMKSRLKVSRETQFWCWFALSCLLGLLSKSVGGPLNDSLAWSFSFSAAVIAFWRCR
jgi:hypothetical protein